MVPTMVSFFRRKKPDAAAAPTADAPTQPSVGHSPSGRYSVEELAAAFPDAASSPPTAEAALPVAPEATNVPPSAIDVAPAPAFDATVPAAAGKQGWRDRLRGSGFARSFGGLFSRHPKLDDDLLDEVETAL